jgi:hypothetical protein
MDVRHDAGHKCWLLGGGALIATSLGLGLLATALLHAQTGQTMNCEERLKAQEYHVQLVTQHRDRLEGEAARLYALVQQLTTENAALRKTTEGKESSAQ